MTINGHALPEEFVEILRNNGLRRDVGSFPLSDHDSYGNKLESELSRMFRTEAEIISSTARLPHDFKDDGCYGGQSEWEHQPGFIPDILDFSNVLAFAESGDGSPFCFDFRQRSQPSIIWWDDAYWRLISPSFESFLKLIKQ